MKNLTTFLKQLDTIHFEDVFKGNFQALKEAFNKNELVNCISELSDIKYTQQQAFLEYLDINHDKFLDVVKFVGGEPVVISDKYKPYAGMHGRVISRASNGWNVSFHELDKEDVIPEEHISKYSIDESIRPIKLEIPCTSFNKNGTVSSIIFEDYADINDLDNELSESIIIPNIVNLDSIVTEETLSPEQEKTKEKIVISLKRNKEELVKKYGDKWESVLYAIATKKALEENYIVESASSLIFDHPLYGGGRATITKIGEYFSYKKINSSGEVVDNQMFSNFKDAEKQALGN